MSEGLLVPDTANTRHGVPLPGAATGYDLSADGLTYTFHLRPDAVWSDGSPVTAADFIASYRRVLTPATAAPKAHLFYAVKNARAFLTGALTDFSAVGFSAPSPLTLVITLAQPSPRFPYYVASGPWLPVNPRAVAQHGRTWTQPGHFVGNGPFTLTEWRQQQRIVVKKNHRYRAADTVRLDELQFIRLDSADTEERAFRAGQIDVTMSVPFTKIEPYQRDRPAEFHRSFLAETRYISFNTQRPPLNDPRVRQALSLTIDRQKIVERITRGGQTPSTGYNPVPLDAPLRREPSAHQPRLDPPRARQLLADIGFASGKNFPRFELTAWSPSQIPVLEAIQAMWREHLGLEVSIAIREAKVHLSALAAGQYDIAFVTTLIDVPDATAVLSDFVTGAPGNYPHGSDAAYDALLARLATTADPAARAALQAEADEHLLRAAFVAPLYLNTRTWLMSPRVRDWREDALWTRDYTAVHLDP
ncbi:MAG: peptide ABC transporter substrate-binding protein [Verrucomicrobia bacterium]|nr:peptide ABC transporter substrate-binding protein [Verrucomicrobiota bacterium]